MSRHSDDGPPGSTPPPIPPLPDPAGGPAAPPWTAPPVEPEPSLPRWARRDEDPTAPDPGPAEPVGPADSADELPNIVPGQDASARRLPDLTAPPTEGPGRAAPADPPVEETEPTTTPATSRPRGFRRRTVPATDAHRQVPAIEATTSGTPAPDPSESRTIIPSHTAAPGQLAPGIRGQLNPAPRPTSPPTTAGIPGPAGTTGPFGTGGASSGGGTVSQGQRVPSPVRHAPVPRAQAGQEPPSDPLGPPGPPGEPTAPGPRGFPVPSELPSPPQRPRGSGEPSATDVPGRSSIPAAASTPPAQRTASGAPRPGQLVDLQRRLTPEHIRTTKFGRSPLGRRGYNEDEVNQFTNRLAEELAARDTEVVRLIDENHRLKQAMRDWQSERIDQPDEVVAERVNAETAELVAKAQQQIDAQLAQTELYCRQREQEAVRRYDEIVRHARLQVKREAEQVAHRYRATAGAGYNPDQETLQRQQVYIGALLQALDALGAHVQATRQAFATEIGNLTAAGSTGTATPADPAAPSDPLTQRVD